MIRIIHIGESGHLPATPVTEQRDVEAAVRPILENVRKNGDTALVEYARRFDGLEGACFCVGADEVRAAEQALSADFRRTAEKAISNIREFARAQMPRERWTEFSPGRKLGWVVRPLSAVGCYVPSGRYPLPSTLLMTAVLAQEAGVSRICVTSPKPSKEILGCASMLGLEEIYRIGGAHAIAAMAYGTKSVPRVDRIVGPGNDYVATAKRLLAGEVGIDFVAGPTEILILAADGNPETIAADMLAQAEHDVSACAILITTSEQLAGSVARTLEKQAETLPTAEVARAALNGRSLIAIVPNMDVAVRITNEYAPEHLSLHDPSLLPQIKNAGTIFLGQNSPESAGDYAAGPSHVLPTGGAARLRGGLSITDFVKVISVQELSTEALKDLAPAITTLARAEGLEAHARAVEIRLAD